MTNLHLLERAAIHIMICSTDSSHVCPTSSTENHSECFLIGSQSLFSSFIESFSILISHHSINFQTFTTRCTQICQKQLHKENQSCKSVSEHNVVRPIIQIIKQIRGGNMAGSGRLGNRSKRAGLTPKHFFFFLIFNIYNTIELAQYNILERESVYVRVMRYLFKVTRSLSLNCTLKVCSVKCMVKLLKMLYLRWSSRTYNFCSCF